jgi:hypothetical protein
MVGEVSVELVLERQAGIPHSGDRVKRRLPAFGYLSRHWRSPAP